MKTLLLVLFFSVSTQAADPIKIEPGADPEKYTVEELKKRVWQLEQAVQQMQSQNAAIIAAAPKPEDPTKWKCTLKVSGHSLDGAGPTRYGAVKDVLRKCREVTKPILCRDVAAVCDDK
ncbi:MAG: hypothetical protein AB7O96_05875 [Pseudobdellovibrionaceae bacterium]